MAQRGILYAIDPDTGNPSSEAIIKLKDANSSQVRLTDNGNGTAVVELINGFSSIEKAIRIADSDDDRECLVPLEGRVPWFETGTIDPEINYVDATSNIRFTYLAAAADGSKTATPLKVVDNRNDATAVAVGENLDLGLVNELIAPVMGGGSSSSLLGYEYSPDKDGNLNIRVHIHTYEGVNALIGSNTNSFFTVGKTSLAMPSVSGGHGQAADMQDFKAFNPWRLITSVAQGGVMEDYTLYNEPARDGTKMAVGWSATPLNKPSQPAPNEWTTDIGNVIVEKSEHIAYDASFQDGAGYLGSEVCSHVGAGPAAVWSGFSPSASTYYTVRLRVPDLSNYDWKTIGDYLWYDQGHYLTGVWVSPTATEAQRKQAVNDAFAHGPVILTGWYNTADAAWAHVTLPSGVTRSTPSAIDGAVFETHTRTEPITSTWKLRYSMKDMTESQVKTHNAGKIDVVLRIINPFNDASPSLDKKVAEAYVKLHLYVWPAPYEVVPVSPAWRSVTGHGWGYSAFPFCYTNGKTVYALDGSGFFSKPILLPTTETYTSTSTAFLKGMAASVGAISRDAGRSSYVGSATYQFYNNDAFSDSDTKTRRLNMLLGYMSDNQSTSPFKLRAPTDYKRNELRYSEPVGAGWQPYYENDVAYDGLNKVLGSATFYRADDYTLYYDPTGNERVYTYNDGTDEVDRTNKLFVIHIGGNTMGIRHGHYFDPAWFQ